MEDGLAGCEERGVALAFAELGALLVDGEGDEGGQRVDDVEGVFEADFHRVFGGFRGHPFYVVYCVLGIEVESVVVLLWAVLAGVCEGVCLREEHDK